MQTDFAVHLSGDQQFAHPEPGLLRRNGPESLPVVHHPCCPVRDQVRSWFRLRSRPISSSTLRARFLTISFGFAMVTTQHVDFGVGTSFQQPRYQRSPVSLDSRSTRRNSKRWSRRLPTSNPAWNSRMGRYSRNRHLRHRDHTACCSPSHSDCGHRLRLHRHCCLRW